MIRLVKQSVGHPKFTIKILNVSIKRGLTERILKIKTNEITRNIRLKLTSSSPVFAGVRFRVGSGGSNVRCQLVVLLNPGLVL